MSFDWPHAPVHRLDSDGIYIVTAATLHKEHLFEDAGKLTSLQHQLLSLSGSLIKLVRAPVGGAHGY
jgi:hypothetical protein